MKASTDSGAIDLFWPESEPWSAIGRTTVPEFMVPKLEDRGAEPLVMFDDGFELSCEAFLEQTERFAAYLSTKISTGDRVALAVGNRSEYLIAYYATIANRAVVVGLGPDIGVDDAMHGIVNADCVLAIADRGPAAVLEQVKEKVPSLREILTIEGDEPKGLARYGSDEEPMTLVNPAAEVTDLTDIGFTSGTTGLPKALAGDHTELLHYADSFQRHNRLTADERILCPLQFHYGDPFYMFLASIDAGTPLIVMRKFSVSRFWSVAKEFGATRISTIGAIPNLLLTAEPSAAERDHGIEFANAVAVPASQHQELLDRFGFPWYEGYGSSESGPAIGMPPTAASRYIGTGAIGIPLPEVEARIVDPDGSEAVGPGSGELQLRGHILFDGYLGNEEATAEVLDGDWLRTGDLVERDGDGVYYFRGRSKELIRRGGENLAPAEVEAVLNLHPAVIDAAVVPVPDPLRGEEVKAYVELKGDVSPEELVAFCEGRLARFKVPRYIEVREEPFPRTPSQRIPKAALKVDGEHRVDGAWDREAAS